VLGAHDDWIRELRVSPGATIVASASKDMTVRLWDLYDARQVHILQSHANGADCVAFDHEGAILATGGRDCKIKLWDTASGALLHTLTSHEKPVLTLAFNPTGTMLMSGSGDNSVKLWAVGD
jgi:WD40 repeat protein